MVSSINFMIPNKLHKNEYKIPTVFVYFILLESTGTFFYFFPTACVGDYSHFLNQDGIAIGKLNFCAIYMTAFTDVFFPLIHDDITGLDTVVTFAD